MEEEFCQESRRHIRVSNPHEGESKAVLPHAMKSYVGVEIQLHSFLTSALDEGEWSPNVSTVVPHGKIPPSSPRCALSRRLSDRILPNTKHG